MRIGDRGVTLIGADIAERRAQLLALLATPARNQVLVTTTEPFSGVDGFHEVLYHSVRAGVITEDVGP